MEFSACFALISNKHLHNGSFVNNASMLEEPSNAIEVNREIVHTHNYIVFIQFNVCVISICSFRANRRKKSSIHMFISLTILKCSSAWSEQMSMDEKLLQILILNVFYRFFFVRCRISQCAKYIRNILLFYLLIYNRLILEKVEFMFNFWSVIKFWWWCRIVSCWYIRKFIFHFLFSSINVEWSWWTDSNQIETTKNIDIYFNWTA